MTDNYEILMLRADCEPHRCPHCHAEPGEPCVNPIVGTPARIPCRQRIRAAHDAAVEEARRD